MHCEVPNNVYLEVYENIKAQLIIGDTYSTNYLFV